MSSGRRPRRTGRPTRRTTGAPTMPGITPNLWFDTQSEDAASYYCSIFPNSKINAITHYGEAGPREAGMVLTVEFELDGKPFTAINGGPEFTFDEAVSFAIEC